MNNKAISSVTIQQQMKDQFQSFERMLGNAAQQDGILTPEEYQTLTSIEGK
jgi:hypothetical protein